LHLERLERMQHAHAMQQQHHHPAAHPHHPS
jgi:hypothetical protein